MAEDSKRRAIPIIRLSIRPSTLCSTGERISSQPKNISVPVSDSAIATAVRTSDRRSAAFAVGSVSFAVDLSYARGVAQTSAIDLNLNTTPKFTLATEAGRPVYTPASFIVPTTGAVALIGSRIQPRFGVVSEMNSNLHSDTKQITTSF